MSIDMASTIIRIDNLSAGYGDKTVLEDVSLKVCQNDYLGVIGPNGGGKTTLMRIILGMKKPTKGSIRYYRNGVETPTLTMGYLPQYSSIDREFPISVSDVVLSGVATGRRLFTRYTAAQREAVAQTISHLELDDLKDRHIGALSGGQLQRVLLARALVSHPEVVVLDEPNTYIDRRFQRQMYDTLNEINAHCAIILVSHDIGTILQNVKNVACVNHRLHYHPCAELTPDELTEQLGCPIELLGHGNIPHRVLKKHE